MKLDINLVTFPIALYNKNQDYFYENQEFSKNFTNSIDEMLIRELIQENQKIINENKYYVKIFEQNEKEYLLFISNTEDNELFLLLFIETTNLNNIIGNLKYNQKLERSFYNILESIYDDFTIINKDGIIEKVLPNFQSVYGIPIEEAVGSSIYELEEKKIFNPCVSVRVMKTNKVETMMQLTKNNKYLMCTSIPIFDENGEFEKIISYTRDAEKYELLKEEYENLNNTVSSYKVQLEQLKQEHKKSSKIIGVSKKITRTTEIALKASNFDATVLITGESGVGKNLFADLIHSSSKRKDSPFISINCGAIPEHLLESELFGYEKGAFTGANQSGKAGLIELADHGTLFLDEICDLPLHMQVKLLKVIQEKKVMRLGSISEKTVDFRLIAATNKNIKKAIEEGNFREDLYYRLNVLCITIPALRERKEDIFPLISHFTKKYNEQYNLNHAFSSKSISYLEIYSWPGNIRELENVVERMLLTADDYLITEDQLPYYIYTDDNTEYKQKRTLKHILSDVEKKVILDCYEQYGTTTKVAKELGISQASVSIKLSKYQNNKQTK
ncbi:MAG: Fis family transcriptional regulator [Bacillota bacterium]|nr:Fis family transcriptional regulator [Bacillota bacterium]